MSKGKISAGRTLYKDSFSEESFYLGAQVEYKLTVFQSKTQKTHRLSISPDSWKEMQF